MSLVLLCELEIRLIQFPCKKQKTQQMIRQVVVIRVIVVEITMGVAYVACDSSDPSFIRVIHSTLIVGYLCEALR